MIKLIDLLRETAEDRLANDKNILTSNPDDKSMEKFIQVTEKVFKHFANGETKEIEQFHNVEQDSGFSNMLNPSTLQRHEIKQYIGEYEGPNFKGITQKLAEMYEKAGFKVVEGYGIDDIKGFEVRDQNGEVVGEVDFLEKDSIPKRGHTIIIKCKKTK